MSIEAIIGFCVLFVFYLILRNILKNISKKMNELPDNDSIEKQNEEILNSIKEIEERLDKLENETKN